MKIKPKNLDLKERKKAFFHSSRLRGVSSKAWGTKAFAVCFAQAPLSGDAARVCHCILLHLVQSPFKFDSRTARLTAF